MVAQSKAVAKGMCGHPVDRKVIWLRKTANIGLRRTPEFAAKSSTPGAADAGQAVFICLAEVSLKKYCRDQTWISS